MALTNLPTYLPSFDPPVSHSFPQLHRSPARRASIFIALSVLSDSSLSFALSPPPRGSPSVSHPSLRLHLVQQRSLTVEEASGRAVLPEEQKRSKREQHQHQQEEGNHHARHPGASFRFLDDDHRPTLLGLLAVAAHPVAQHRLGVARLHLHVLVVELPVLVRLVEVSVS